MNHGNVSPEIAQGLLVLKDRIQGANIPPSKIDESLNIATWNIREFAKKRRTEAAIHYVAEVLGQFDLIGVVEQTACVARPESSMGVAEFRRMGANSGSDHALH